MVHHQWRTNFNQGSIVKYCIKWVLLCLPLAAVVGSLVAFFLWLLDAATAYRWQHPWLLYLLPLGGIVIYLLYHYGGKNADGGNNLIIEEIHEPDAGIPVRMAPLVLFTTLLTHLLGGSAGREGTAVQIGGSMAALLGKWCKLGKKDIRTLLMCGIAAGFGAVFGTPVTGAIFALEVLAIGRIFHHALLPCLLASLLADMVCTAWQIPHTHYEILSTQAAGTGLSFLKPDIFLLLKVGLAGVLFGLAGYLFAELTHAIKHYSHQCIAKKWLIPVVGGLLVIALSLLLGTPDYLGLGVVSNRPDGVSIVNAFKPGGAGYLSWFWKLLFTAITIGMGFKGGEVTPLFFIGATLGCAYAGLSGAPVDLLAGLGFIAVFAAATNTPIACTIMGVELFGGDHILYYALACFVAYYFSGHSTIYKAQKSRESKVRSPETVVGESGSSEDGKSWK